MSESDLVVNRHVVRALKVRHPRRLDRASRHGNSGSQNRSDIGGLPLKFAVGATENLDLCGLARRPGVLDFRRLGAQLMPPVYSLLRKVGGVIALLFGLDTSALRD